MVVVCTLLSRGWSFGGALFLLFPFLGEVDACLPYCSFSFIADVVFMLFILLFSMILQ